MPMVADQPFGRMVFVGSGDRGVYGFAAAAGEQLPSSLLFVFDPATLHLKVRHGLLSTIVVLAGGPERDVVVLRGNRFGRTRTTPAIAAMWQLISTAPSKEA
jgi:hypothetical protein